MNKKAIKNYAVWARRELIDRIAKKAVYFGVSAEGNPDPKADAVDGRLLSDTEKKQRAALIARVATHGYEQTIEEVAYTWFNRFAALRFMEVNGYLPSHVRVFTNDVGEFKPQILAEAIHLELSGLDKEKVYALKESNDDEALFRYLIVVQCNALNEILPGMFQRIEDYTGLLLPDNLLREGSIIHRMITDIPEEDFYDAKSSEGEEDEESRIEIIGWLYQYYISEKHEEVVDPLHGKIVKKDEIPAATQLFTTDWVVRYLIDNSVGRYWIERNPNGNLAEKLTYFVKPKDGKIKNVNEKITPQELTVFDPCVGSGHFLVYAFEVLMKIYKEYGFSERDAAVEIVNNNLYGLDIDGRAVQLACFAVMMKARRYDRRFFDYHIQPHVYEILESNGEDKAGIDYFCNGNTALKKEVKAILETFHDAKEYGSILQVPVVDFGKINERLAQIADEASLYNTYLLGDFQKLMCVAEIMSRKYAVVATNPPYLNKYDAKLKEYIINNYNDYKGDLFSVFMYRNFDYCLEKGYSCFMTPMVWMFIQTYEKLRKHIIGNKSITTLIQFEYSAYEEATVPICTFVLQNYNSGNNGYYLRLVDYRGGMEVQRQKALEAIATRGDKIFFEAYAHNFVRINGAPLAYWANETIFTAFDNCSISEFAISNGQNITGNNNRFLRLFWEVNFTNIQKNYWAKCARGGGFRRYHGNDDNVILWTDSARTHYHTDRIARIVPKELRFKEGITWSYITSSIPSFRKLWSYELFEKAGTSVFIKDTTHLSPLLGLLNSIVAKKLLEFINPTINYQVRDILSLPVFPSVLENKALTTLVDENINLTQRDWDSFETSWDFQEHPFARWSRDLWDATAIGATMFHYYGGHPKVSCPLELCFMLWQGECNERFTTLKQNEEELNRIFIDIYGLQDELTPGVEDKDVTVRKADLARDIRSFISYAVGCMMGRYSLDVPGLAYAGGKWDKSKYKTFQPDSDAILPICDDEYFDDDIVGRFVEFVATVYGKDTMEENLQFIADALGGRGTPREVIRNYFLTGFYADHVTIYKKRPIYWLFDSGKKNGFKCLVYMHRYRPDTIARIRTDYIHEQQSRYRTAMETLERGRDNAATNAEKVKLGRKLAAIEAQAKELREYEEKIHHLADQMIAIDLDDGVKHNYALFKDVLAKIK